MRLTDPLKRKQLKKGLEQLSEEGAVQLFFDRMRLERDPILGAVGVLQFEVIQHRLKSEYGVNVGFDRLPYLHARWIEGEPVEPGQVRAAGLDHVRARRRGAAAGAVRQRLGDAHRRYRTTRSCSSSPPCSPDAARARRRRSHRNGA